MKEFYDTNDDFRKYVNKYCNKHKLTVDEALNHSMVREAYNYYREETKNIYKKVDDK